MCTRALFSLSPSLYVSLSLSLSPSTPRPMPILHLCCSDLSQNNLVGTLPTELASMSKLIELSVLLLLLPLPMSARANIVCGRRLCLSIKRTNEQTNKRVRLAVCLCVVFVSTRPSPSPSLSLSLADIFFLSVSRPSSFSFSFPFPFPPRFRSIRARGQPSLRQPYPRRSAGPPVRQLP